MLWMDHRSSRKEATVNWTKLKEKVADWLCGLVFFGFLSLMVFVALPLAVVDAFFASPQREGPPLSCKVTKVVTIRLNTLDRWPEEWVENYETRCEDGLKIWLGEVPQKQLKVGAEFHCKRLVWISGLGRKKEWPTRPCVLNSPKESPSAK